MDIQARKQALRQHIIAARASITDEERRRLSVMIADRLSGLDAYRTAATILGYINFGAEFAAEVFVRRALSDNKKIALPKVNRQTRQLDIYRVTDLGRDLAPGMWNIREPLAEHCEKMDDLAKIDFILLPGVAFWRDGARLGYGGGFYDKLLARMYHHPALVAGAFEMQVVEDIPQEETDKRVEWLITENEIIHCSR